MRLAGGAGDERRVEEPPGSAGADRQQMVATFDGQSSSSLLESGSGHMVETVLCDDALRRRGPGGGRGEGVEVGVGVGVGRHSSSSSSSSRCSEGLRLGGRMRMRHVVHAAKRARARRRRRKGLACTAQHCWGTGDGGRGGGTANRGRLQSF